MLRDDDFFRQLEYIVETENMLHLAFEMEALEVDAVPHVQVWYIDIDNRHHSDLLVYIPLPAYHMSRPLGYRFKRHSNPFRDDDSWTLDIYCLCSRLDQLTNNQWFSAIHGEIDISTRDPFCL